MSATSRPSGIVIHEDGTKEIPASERLDGSKRATIRVRPGFTPTEDIAKYRPSKTRSVLPQNLSKKIDTAPLTSIRTAPLGDISARPSKVSDQAPKTMADQREIAPSKQVKSSWSEAGWRGATDSPSRFARSSDPAPLRDDNLKGPSMTSPPTVKDSKGEKDKRSTSSRAANNQLTVNDGVSDSDLASLEARLKDVALKPNVTDS